MSCVRALLVRVERSGRRPGLRGAITVAMLVATLCVAGCDGNGESPLSGASLGATCALSEGCDEALVCVQGFCRSPCPDSGDCGTGEGCQDQPQGPAVCLPLDTVQSDASSDDATYSDGAAAGGSSDPAGEAGPVDAAEQRGDADARDGGIDGATGADDARAAADAVDAPQTADAHASPSDGAAPEDAGRNAGSACSTGQQCASGHCSPDDGVCCDLACTGTCMACVSSKTGYPSGVCAPISAGTDPETECSATGASTCGANGTGCNGSTTAPGCRFYPQDAVCAPAVCTNGMATASRSCDGVGVCAAKTATSCGAYRCTADGGGCRTSCSANEHCVSGYRCSAQSSCVLASAGAQILWTTKWGDASSSSLVSAVGPLVVDSRGYSVFGMRCSGPGGMPCDSVGSQALLTADASGTKGWSGALGFRALGASLAIGPSDEVVAGFVNNWSGGCCNATLRTYAANGTERWTRSLGASTVSEPPWVSTNPAGEITVMLGATSTSDYGGGTPIGPRVILRYNAANQYLDSRTWPTAEPFKSDSGGNVWTVGGADVSTAVGCGAPSSTTSLFAAKLSNSGACLWSREFGGTRRSSAFTVGADGSLLIAAIVSGDLNFGAGSPPAINTVDLAVAKLDSSGTVLWNRRYSGSAFDGGAQVSVSANGSVFVAGSFVGAIDFGSGPLVASAGTAYLAKLSSTGLLVGQHQFKGGEDFEIAASPDGDVLVVAMYRLFGTPLALDFGAGPVFTNGGDGFALTKLHL